MKISIERDQLLQGLNRVQGVVDKRNTVPILANLLLDASNTKKLRVVATDLEVGINSLLEAKITQPGRVTINARNLTEITRQLPNQTVQFETLANHDIEINCGKSHFKLHGLPPEDFPSLPEVESQKAFTLPAADLAAMIDSTAFSISTDETRFNLGGALLEQTADGLLRMVSSDGHRLTVCDRKLEAPAAGFKGSIIIPRKGLLEIRKLAAETKDELEFSLAKSNCVVKAGETTLVVRLIDGEFPEYRQVLPNETNMKRVLLKREDFSAALRRISVLSQEKTKGLRVMFEKDLLKISVNNPDLGEAEEELDISYGHPPMEIGFNAKYLMDALQVIQNTEVEFLLTDGMSQGVLKEKGSDLFRAVIMPMKLL